MTIEERVRTVFADPHGADVGKLALDADYAKVLLFDDLDHIELFVELERVFAFDEIPDEVSQEWKTMQQIIDWVAKTVVEA